MIQILELRSILLILSQLTSLIVIVCGEQTPEAVKEGLRGQLVLRLMVRERRRKYEVESMEGEDRERREDLC